MIRLGVVGYSEGNGHPFSFSSIINGYDGTAMSASGWPVIHDYLRSRDSSEFASFDARVTCAWMPDPEMTRRLCGAALIPNALHSLDEMYGQVDGVMILRDDASSHLPLALPFLDRGVSVFIDKPLSLSLKELGQYVPHLRSGRLMSCAALRFATELDDVRGRLEQHGALRLIRGAVVLDWARYGIHMLEAALSIWRARPVAVSHVGGAECDVFCVRLEDGGLMDIACLGRVPKTFRLDVFGAHGTSSRELADNFGAFKRTIGAFITMMRSSVPAIPPDETIAVIRTILAGRAAQKLGREVLLGELETVATIAGVA